MAVIESMAPTGISVRTVGEIARPALSYLVTVPGRVPADSGTYAEIDTNAAPAPVTSPQTMFP